MIRISKKADYAVFAMSYLARQAVDCDDLANAPLVSAQEIANVSSLNKSVIANLLKDLGRAGLLDSVRGVRGGYRLARASDRISLAEILAVVDGPLSIVDCANVVDALREEGDPAAAKNEGHDGCCNLESFCPSKLPMQILNERVHGLLTDLRLDELSGLRRRPITMAERTAPLPQPAAPNAPIPAATRPAGTTFPTSAR